MEFEGRRYTPTLPIASESTHVVRLAPWGSLVTQASFGSEFLPSYNELRFGGANVGPAGIVTTVALATTYTGLVLSNPVGSGVILDINDVAASFGVVFPALSYVGLMTGYSGTTDVTHTTPVTTAKCLKIGSVETSKAKLDSSATLTGTPVLTQVFGHCLASAAGSFTHELNGSMILIPGAWVAIYTSTVSAAAALMASFTWDEIRIA